MDAGWALVILATSSWRAAIVEHYLSHNNKLELATLCSSKRWGWIYIMDVEVLIAA
jgi:hypothetical protein